MSEKGREREGERSARTHRIPHIICVYIYIYIHMCTHIYNVYIYIYIYICIYAFGGCAAFVCAIRFIVVFVPPRIAATRRLAHLRSPFSSVNFSLCLFLSFSLPPNACPLYLVSRSLLSFPLFALASPRLSHSLLTTYYLLFTVTTQCATRSHTNTLSPLYSLYLPSLLLSSSHVGRDETRVCMRPEERAPARTDMHPSTARR